MRYDAKITAGALKLAESRIVADLLSRELSEDKWKEAILSRNVLQARNSESAIRLTRLIRERLELMERPLWIMIRDRDRLTATHAILAAAVKHSPLLGDFLDLTVREQYRLFQPALSNALWEEYMAGCRGRDPDMPLWNESTRRRLRSSVFQSLAQAGYIENTRALRLQPVHIVPEVIQYLSERNETYVLRCLQVSP